MKCGFLLKSIQQYLNKTDRLLGGGEENWNSEHQSIQDLHDEGVNRHWIDQKIYGKNSCFIFWQNSTFSFFLSVFTVTLLLRKRELARHGDANVGPEKTFLSSGEKNAEPILLLWTPKICADVRWGEDWCRDIVTSEHKKEREVTRLVSWLQFASQDGHVLTLKA